MTDKDPSTVHRVDQSQAAAKEMAGMVAAFYEGLRERDVNWYTAMRLTVAYVTVVLGPMVTNSTSD